MPAAVQALSHFPKLKVILVGDHSTISSQLSALGTQPTERLSIQHSRSSHLRQKKPSLCASKSVMVALWVMRLICCYSPSGCLRSGGNTGALMALSCFKLKLLPGIDRPALSLHFRPLQVAEAGCSTSERMYRAMQKPCFSLLLGSALAEQHIGIVLLELPCLNVGAEEIKGNDL